jgi:Ca2+-binding RTX toxin-like protein
MHHRSTFRRVTLGLAGVLPLLAAGLYQAGPVAAALAPVNATVAVGSTGLVYTGLSGANDIGVNVVGGRFVITDSAPITAGTGCLPTAKGVFEVTCQVPLNANGTPKTFRVSGGDGDDVVRNNTTLIMRADGGQGNDFLVGGSATDILSDSFGRDTLRGGGGDDTLNTDLSQPDGLTDTLEGGPAGADEQRHPARWSRRGRP